MSTTKLTVVRHSAEVTDADIDQMIENLRQQRQRRRSRVARRKATWSRWKPGRRPVIERLPAEGAEQGTIIIGQGMMFEQIEQAHVAPPRVKRRRWTSSSRPTGAPASPARTSR